MVLECFKQRSIEKLKLENFKRVFLKTSFSRFWQHTFVFSEKTYRQIFVKFSQNLTQCMWKKKVLGRSPVFYSFRFIGSTIFFFVILRGIFRTITEKKS